MAREVTIGGVGKNPSIDKLTQVNPAQFSTAARKQLEKIVIREANRRASALPRRKFSAIVSGAFRDEETTNAVFRLMSERIKRPEAKKYLDAMDTRTCRDRISRMGDIKASRIEESESFDESRTTRSSNSRGEKTVR